jgi:alkylated DNA repair protein (DNA oxidative demethylase)
VSDLFEITTPGLWHFPGMAEAREAELTGIIDTLTLQAPFRIMATPGGSNMSAAMSNCGGAGWVSDRTGYRYARTDPLTQNPWPAMPAPLRTLASEAALRAGFANFTPDVCLINRYQLGAKMALHQDRDEADFTAPIVSLSLGLSAIFLWGGAKRADKPVKLPLHSGDVVVWGGASRLNFHGVAPLKPGPHKLGWRYNLTFRKAL